MLDLQGVTKYTLLFVFGEEKKSGHKTPPAVKKNISNVLIYKQQI